MISNKSHKEESIGEGVNIDTHNNSYEFRIVRINYKTDQNVWMGQKYIKLPFDYEANAKLSYSIIDDSSDIWKYKVNITYYYDGTKGVTLNVNIENGAIQGEKMIIILFLSLGSGRRQVVMPMPLM